MTNTIQINQQYIFLYPSEFVTLPDYSAHRLHKVKVLRRLSQEECGHTDYPMYAVEADDGWTGTADECELGHIGSNGELVDDSR